MRPLSLVLLPCLPAALPAQQAPIDFLREVAPILQSRCVECHGEEEQEADLRLDRRDGLFHQYRNEWVVVPGKPEESPLLERVGLPLDDPDVMPADGTKLSAADIETLRRWIAEGAAWPDDADAWFVAARQAVVPEPLHVPALSEAEQQAEDAAIRALTERGILAQRVAADTRALDVNMSLLRGAAGDAEVALLDGLQKTLVWLNLSHTGVTDEGLRILAGMTELRRLHLAGTAITDAGLVHLAGLDRLEYLNLYGTKVSDAGLIHLAALPSLQKVYLWQTRVTPPAVASLRRVRQGMHVDDGSYVEERLAAAEAEVAAREAAAAAARQEEKARVVKPANAVCPVSGKPVDPAIAVDYQGKRIAFCCEKCKARFEADPAAFSK